MKFKKLTQEFYIAAFSKDVVVCAIMTILFVFAAIKFGATEGEWATFVLFMTLAAGSACFACWFGKQLFEEIDKRDAENKKNWSKNW